MKVKSHSMLLGYCEYEASMKKYKEGLVLYVHRIGKLYPNDYIKNGFRVIDANPKEIKALVARGYETKRLFAKFYDLKPTNDKERNKNYERN